jgi:hypothetical protein
MPELAAVAEEQEEINPYIGKPVEDLVREYGAAKEIADQKKRAYDEAKATQDAIQAALVDYAENNPGTGKISIVGVGTASFGEEEVFSIDKEQWDDFYRYIASTNSFHLLQRRISNAPLREMKQIGAELPPGVSSFTRKKVGFRRSTR